MSVSIYFHKLYWKQYVKSLFPKVFYNIFTLNDEGSFYSYSLLSSFKSTKSKCHSCGKMLTWQNCLPDYKCPEKVESNRKWNNDGNKDEWQRLVQWSTDLIWNSRKHFLLTKKWLRSINLHIEKRKTSVVTHTIKGK